MFLIFLIDCIFIIKMRLNKIKIGFAYWTGVKENEQLGARN